MSSGWPQDQPDLRWPPVPVQDAWPPDADTWPPDADLRGEEQEPEPDGAVPGSGDQSATDPGIGQLWDAGQGTSDAAHGARDAGQGQPGGPVPQPRPANQPHVQPANQRPGYVAAPRQPVPEPDADDEYDWYRYLSHGGNPPASNGAGPVAGEVDAWDDRPAHSPLARRSRNERKNRNERNGRNERKGRDELQSQPERRVRKDRKNRRPDPEQLTEPSAEPAGFAEPAGDAADTSPGQSLLSYPYAANGHPSSVAADHGRARPAAEPFAPEPFAPEPFAPEPAGPEPAGPELPGPEPFGHVPPGPAVVARRPQKRARNALRPPAARVLRRAAYPDATGRAGLSGSAVRSRRAVRSSKRRSRRILVLAAGALVGVAVAVVLLAGPGAGPAHVLVTPAKLGAYVKEPHLAKAMDASLLQRQFATKSAGEAKNVVYAVYEDSTGAAAHSGPQIILFIGGNLKGASPSGFISSLVGESRGAQRTNAGSMAGQAACVPRIPGSIAECVWVDNDTFGVVASQTLSVSALAAELREIRPQVEHLAK